MCPADNNSQLVLQIVSTWESIFNPYPRPDRTICWSNVNFRPYFLLIQFEFWFNFRPYYLLIQARKSFRELLVTAIVDTPPEEEDVLVRSNYLPVILHIIYYILGEEGSWLCHSEDGRAPELTLASTKTNSKKTKATLEVKNSWRTVYSLTVNWWKAKQWSVTSSRSDSSIFDQTPIA